MSDAAVDPRQGGAPRPGGAAPAGQGTVVTPPAASRLVLSQAAAEGFAREIGRASCRERVSKQV